MFLFKINAKKSLDAEKEFGGVIGFFYEFVERNITKFGDFFGGVPRESGFVALSAVWDGGEIGRISFEHEGAAWAKSGGGGDLIGFFESDDAGERNQAAESENALGEFGGARETVKNGTHFLMVILVNGEGVVKGGLARAVARVDDEVEAVGTREFEMTAEKIALTGVVIVFRPAVGGGVKIVEARFAEGGHFGVVEMRSEEIFKIVGRILDIAGMDAEAGVNFGESLCEMEVFFEIVGASGQGDEAGDAVCARVFDEFRNFCGRKFGGAEVTMGVGHESGNFGGFYLGR